MRKFSILFLVLFCVPVLAQYTGPAHRVQLLPTKTVAQLGAASAFPGYMVRISDGTSASDCTVGGGATQGLCWSNGTVWAAFGGGGGVSFPLLAPNGSAAAPSYSFSGNSSMGIYRNAGQLGIEDGGGGTFSLGSNLFVIGVNSNTGFTSEAASTMALGNGTLNDETALLRSANACRVNSDITLSTSATNICSFSLAAIARAWAWQCQIMWAVTAGTTPTIAIGVNPSQTPTGTTNGAASILTTNADVGTEGTAPISASGSTTLLTSPTLTTSATVFQAASFGTFLASGTAGTFAINMTGTGAGFAGTAKAGTTCYLY